MQIEDSMSIMEDVYLTFGPLHVDACLVNELEEVPSPFSSFYFHSHRCSRSSYTNMAMQTKDIVDTQMKFVHIFYANASAFGLTLVLGKVVGILGCYNGREVIVLAMTMAMAIEMVMAMVLVMAVVKQNLII